MWHYSIRSLCTSLARLCFSGWNCNAFSIVQIKRTRNGKYAANSITIILWDIRLSWIESLFLMTRNCSCGRMWFACAQSSINIFVLNSRNVWAAEVHRKVKEENYILWVKAGRRAWQRSDRPSPLCEQRVLSHSAHVGNREDNKIYQTWILLSSPTAYKQINEWACDV